MRRPAVKLFYDLRLVISRVLLVRGLITLKGVVKLFFLLLLLCFVEINLFFLRDTLGFSGVSEVETRLSLSR